MTPRRRCALLLAALLTASVAEGVVAQGRWSGDADHAAEQARQRTGGRVIDVRPKPGNGDGGYQVKILTRDGRVRTIDVPEARAEDRAQRGPDNGRRRR
ncbi:MAG: hypothetical protein H6983_03700 [Ectothiorhodospiraceae bacterium]|nr:hypothetical protein [Ectothiorhodospiraceae bacterium]